MVVLPLQARSMNIELRGGRCEWGFTGLLYWALLLQTHTSSAVVSNAAKPNLIVCWRRDS